METDQECESQVEVMEEEEQLSIADGVICSCSVFVPLNLLFQNDRLFHVTAKELVGNVCLVCARMQVGDAHRCAPVGRNIHARIRYNLLYIEISN